MAKKPKPDQPSKAAKPKAKAKPKSSTAAAPAGKRTRSAAAKATKATAGKSSKPAARRRSPRKVKGPTTEEIAERAYHIYEEEGGGSEVEHWLRAERELTSA